MGRIKKGYGFDAEYAGVLYGLIPVVISATLGSIGGPSVIGIPVPMPCPISIPISPYVYSSGEVKTVNCVADQRGPMGVLESEKGTAPARRAMSASPSCQCIASAARHGTPISWATWAHISALNLRVE